ncbi:MAG: hydantoinase B/oxoprolinase family protein [Pseudomonadota bacterium]
MIDGRAMLRMRIVHERLLAIAEDVGHALIRGAFSSNIKERMDCSTAIFDAEGRLIAQADHMPIHIGSLLWGVRTLLERGQGFAAGEAFVMNDPYLAGGTHLPDISVISPVFAEGRLSHFVGNIAHHADVGGPTPGSVSGRSPDIFSEGLRLPPIRIARGGVPDDDLIELIAANTRAPLERRLDLKTQIGSNARGAALLGALIEDLGLSAVERAGAEICDYTARRLAAAVRALPDGQWTATRYLDDDGATSDPVPLVATVRVAGDRLSFDFTGSGAEAAGAVNLSASSLEATVAYAVKALIDPELPANSGLIDAVEIRVTEGTILSPRPPAAVAARAVTSNRLAGAIFDALRPALPVERRMAASNDSTSLVVFAGEGFVYPESIGGGGGAMADRDGQDGIHVHTVNSTNLPIEALETSYPLRCTRYALVEGSGGAGQQAGGLGIAREVEALVDGVALTVRSDGHIFPAPGADGGQPGSVTRIRLTRRSGEVQELGSKTSVTLDRGDRVLVETLGGGGYGAPEMRTDAALRGDLESGRLSREAAEAAYGPDRVRRLT